MSRSHSPVARAFVHTSLGVISVLVVLVLGKDLVAAILAVAAAALLLIEWLRFRSLAVNRWLMAKLFIFIREEEANHLTGATFYIIGSGLTLAFFPAEIAITAILFLAIGDPLAALVGKWWGKRRFWGKSLEGNLSCLAVCLLIGILLAGLQPDLSVAITVTGAVFAFIFETLPWPVNDNITIPVGSAAAMMVLQSILQM